MVRLLPRRYPPCGSGTDRIRIEEDIRLIDQYARYANRAETEEQLIDLGWGPGSRTTQSLVPQSNRAALVDARHEVKASLDLAERAYDVLLGDVLRTVMSDGDRMLNRRRLDCFTRATSIGFPSQTAVDLLSKVSAPGRAPPPDEDRLRELAGALLEVNTPPSLPALFGDAPDVAKEALASLSRADRIVIRQRRSDYILDETELPPGTASLMIGHEIPGDKKGDLDRISRTSARWYFQAQRIPEKIEAMKLWSEALLTAFKKAGGIYPG